MLLAALGVFSVAGFQIWQRYSPHPVDIQFRPAVVVTGSGLPVRVSIPQIGLDLPVIAASRSAHRFPTTAKGVTFLTSSALPGQSGSAVLYGHNWVSLLRPLHQAQIGQKMLIKLENGQNITYEIRDIRVVSPGNSAVFTTSSAATSSVILYTCTGFLDRQRLVVTADLISG